MRRYSIHFILSIRYKEHRYNIEKKLYIELLTPEKNKTRADKTRKPTKFSVMKPEATPHRTKGKHKERQ
jgi:hypothetical protein